MKVSLVRVDNRLVHGQILEAWVPFTTASCIAVVNDAVASDFFHETVIRMAIPREMEVIVSSVKDFAETYAHDTGEGAKTIILFASIADAFRAFNLGFRFHTLNIGNSYAEICTKHCSASVHLSDEDIRQIEYLLDEGAAVELQRVPREKAIDMRTLASKKTP
jgi:mannose/fructose/N-acetylgalactosamine-specific phosphotransferase system component IIB